ncbi:hypothetical protein, partial [Moorena sp. SIO1G6]|uniref:hypothetical protein n=1 Tax=Moorena sp. SIO1G6 TaxID=2607840 RepID=UPI00257EF4BD
MIIVMILILIVKGFEKFFLGVLGLIKNKRSLLAEAKLHRVAYLSDNRFYKISDRLFLKLVFCDSVYCLKVPLFKLCFINIFLNIKLDKKSQVCVLARIASGIYYHKYGTMDIERAR